MGLPEPQLRRQAAPDDDEQDFLDTTISHSARRRRRPNIVLGVFAVLVLASQTFVWVRFYHFDPEKLRLSPQEHPWYFPALMIHIVGSSLALATCVLQVWPWLRRRYPVVHRISGRLYVFAGIYPAAVSALVLTFVWPTNPITAFSDLLTSLLWLAITTTGFVLARRRRTADHRRWMLSSFALTISVMFNQLLFLPVSALIISQLPSDFPGGNEAGQLMASGTIVWLGWTLPFLGISWWLEREQLRRPVHRFV
jgi:uncharacterized membrane protein